MQALVYQSIEQKRKLLELKRKEIEEGQLNAIRELLPNHVIANICSETEYSYRRRLIPPSVTVFHMLGAGMSCETSFQSAWHNSGQTGHSDVLSRARARLPIQIWKGIDRHICIGIESEYSDKEKWRGHRVLGIDGTCCSMSDTPQLVAHFGRAGSKAGQSRFPLGRGVIVFSLATFRAVSHEFGPYIKGENELFEKQMSRLQKNDLIVADRRYAGAKRYIDYTRNGLHYITRAHQRLHVEKLRVLKRISRDDFLVELPISRVYRKGDPTLPESVAVRIIKTRAKVRGKREIFWVVTSLLDAEKYPRGEIKLLYKKRWKIEGLIEELKIWLGADVLRSKTVAGVYKELYARIIAYNLVHWLILKAAKKYGKQPGQISTAAALRLTVCYSLKMSTAPGWRLRFLYDQLLEKIACSIVISRPGRIEPRMKKRDQKHYLALKISRAKWREINGIAA